MKLTKKEVIREMLADELRKDERFASLSVEAALSAIKIDKMWLAGKAYLLYRAYKDGFYTLKKSEQFFVEEAAALSKRLEYRTMLINWAREIHAEVETAVNNTSNMLPF